ncbi:MAG: hypothetical protein K0B05_03425 [Bacteroidales bacterium]|nr:hypothetical protein [Bacteroidales bacterium]
MLLRILRGTGPGVVILIIVIAILLWIGSFLNPHISYELYYESDPMPLYALLKSITGGNHAVGLIVTFSMVLLMAYLLVSFNTSVIFISERTFLPAVVYVMLSALFPAFQVLNPVLPASIFLVLAAGKIMKTYRVQGIAYDLFDAGFLISTGCLFYANFIWFAALLVIGIILIRPAGLREFVIALTGMATPFALTSGFYYVLDKGPETVFLILERSITGDIPDYALNGFSLLVLILPGLLLLFSILHLLPVLNTGKISSRKTFYLLFWILFIAGAIFIFSPSVSFDIIWLAGMPVSYFLAHFLIFFRRKVITEISFALFFLLVFLIQILELVR